MLNHDLLNFIPKKNVLCTQQVFWLVSFRYGFNWLADSFTTVDRGSADTQ